jgi:hypothetical protein
VLATTQVRAEGSARLPVLQPPTRPVSAWSPGHPDQPPLPLPTMLLDPFNRQDFLTLLKASSMPRKPPSGVHAPAADELLS